MELDDELLIKRCLAGDDAAFGFLVDRYKRAVYALAYRKLGNFHDVQDIAQEAFLKAYLNLPKFKPPYNFASWLYVITANCCRMWLRKHKKRERNIPLEILPGGEIQKLSFERYADDELKQKVRDAVSSLPESEQLAVTLHYMSGLSCKDIGMFLGISAHAVETRLYRARKKLKEEMTEMIEKRFATQKLGASFTMQLMEIVGKLNPILPSKLKPEIKRLIPIGTTITALTLGIGLSFHSPISSYTTLNPQKASIALFADISKDGLISLQPVELAHMEISSAKQFANALKTKTSANSLVSAEVLAKRTEGKDASNRVGKGWLSIYDNQGGPYMALGNPLPFVAQKPISSMTLEGWFYIEKIEIPDMLEEVKFRDSEFKEDPLWEFTILQIGQLTKSQFGLYARKHSDQLVYGCNLPYLSDLPDGGKADLKPLTGQQLNHDAPWPSEIDITQKWHHIALVLDIEADCFKLFLDGKLGRSEALCFGQMPGDYNFVDCGNIIRSAGYYEVKPEMTQEPAVFRYTSYHGKGDKIACLDGIRISAVARYKDNFTPERRYVADEYTMALWYFDDTDSEGTYRDASKNGIRLMPWSVVLKHWNA